MQKDTEQTITMTDTCPAVILDWLLAALLAIFDNRVALPLS